MLLQTSALISLSLYELLKLFWLRPRTASLNFSKHWYIYYRATADTLHVDVHIAGIAKGKTYIFTFILTLSWIFQFLRTLKQRVWNIQNSLSLCILTYNNLCLILNLLCCTENNVTSYSTVMQQTGTVLDISKFYTQCVSIVWNSWQPASPYHLDNVMINDN